VRRGGRAGGAIRTISLGPFILEARIGRGGMGEVWRARHGQEQVPVAVKVLTAKGSSRPMFVDSFRNEVRAVATLDHPHIVMVLDYGSVPDQAAEASRGKLVGGTPYLSMELVEGETLADHMGSLEWPEIERIMHCLLDALAHAHARGVIHRDLKLSNVLYDPKSGAVKLTDFGIAHAMAATGDPFRWGTPAYMPPEQLLGRWWDYGPWTDLYSLGCCGYALTTGERAFPDEVSGTNSDRLLPPMNPAMDVPAGFEDWLRALTEPEPGARFQVAADAALALHRVTRVFAPSDSRIQASTLQRSVQPATTITLAYNPTDPDHEEAMGGPVLSPKKVPPMPKRWRRRRAPRPSSRLVGAGLGLYGLRRIPMVGRAKEREALWRGLRAVRASGRARVVVIEGPAGSGKSRLGQWLYERAHEVGAASVMRATHGEGGGVGGGLGPMVARYLRTGGLAAGQIRQRAELALQTAEGTADPREVRGLLELVAPGAGEGEAFTSTAERHAVVRRFVLGQAQRRPVVLFLDDVQWGLDSLEFAISVLDAQDSTPAPVLIIAAGRDEALAERALERTAIDELAGSRNSSRLRVDPLSAGAHRALVEELLGLEGALARVVEERTSGNPMFAVQLVGDWVQRGILVTGPRGFVLRPGAQITLPDSLFAVWADRVDDLLADRPEQDRNALEIAAVLGERIDPSEWRASCNARGIEPSDNLLDQLLSRRLARPDESGGKGTWSFAHSMLRESLERQADEAGRSASHHRACAAMLQAFGTSGERLARHLFKAGAFERSLKPLVEAMEGAVRAGEFDRADGLLELWQAAIERLSLPDGDRRRVPGLRAAAAVHRYKDRPAKMLETCERLEAGVAGHRWPRDLLAYVRLQQGRLARMDGRFADAVRLYRAGVVLSADSRTSTALHARIGQTLVSLGAFSGAEAEFNATLELAKDNEDQVGIGDAWAGLGTIALNQGELDLATRRTARARDAYRAARHRWGLAKVHEMFGEIARHRRSWDEAVHCYHSAAGIWSALGTESAALHADVNIALVQVERGDPVGVARDLDQLAARADAFGNRALWATIRLAQLSADATAGNPHAWDAHFAEGADAIAGTQYLSPNVALAAELAGRAAARRSWDDRAREAFELAIAQWMRLGREEDADRVRWALP